MKRIVLSRDQETALTRIRQWLSSSEQFFILEGPAGSGKTELARLIAEMRETMFCSLTGKAANVLRNRGVSASTVHRSLYKPKEKSRIKVQAMTEQLIALELQYDKTPTQQLRAQCDKLRSELRHERKRTASPSWSVPEDAPVKTAQLLVIDEYSMLDDKIVNDLRTHAKKVLFLGDPYQLPPVHGKCPLAGKPDYVLTEIHRQAWDNPILAALTRIREGKSLPSSKSNEHGTWELLSKEQTSWDGHYSICDQLIVARNKTRARFNERYRKMYGYTDTVNVGERVIFLRNDHELEVFNGSTARVKHVVDSGDALIELYVSLDDGREQLVDSWSGVFKGNDIQDCPRMTQAADYGYAITCHKAQGSEYDHVVVWNEGAPSDQRRWMYTAASRAKQRCTFIEV